MGYKSIHHRFAPTTDSLNMTASAVFVIVFMNCIQLMGMIIAHSVCFVNRCLSDLTIETKDLLDFSVPHSLLRMIFPLVVFGRLSRNSTMRGYLYGAVWVLT